MVASLVRLSLVLRRRPTCSWRFPRSTASMASREHDGWPGSADLRSSKQMSGGFEAGFRGVNLPRENFYGLLEGQKIP